VRHHDSRGVALIEVMAALTLLLIVALGFTLGVLTLFNKNRTTKNLTVATDLAQAKVEEIRMGGSSALVNGNDKIDSSGGPGGTFTRVWTVTSSYGGLNGLFRLDVTVNWAGGSVTLSTLVGT
jgi:Tfp pilus assembly protein PilV